MIIKLFALEVIFCQIKLNIYQKIGRALERETLLVAKNIFTLHMVNVEMNYCRCRIKSLSTCKMVSLNEPTCNGRPLIIFAKKKRMKKKLMNNAVYATQIFNLETCSKKKKENVNLPQTLQWWAKREREKRNKNEIVFIRNCDMKYWMVFMSYSARFFQFIKWNKKKRWKKKNVEFSTLNLWSGLAHLARFSYIIRFSSAQYAQKQIKWYKPKA